MRSLMSIGSGSTRVAINSVYAATPHAIPPIRGVNQPSCGVSPAHRVESGQRVCVSRVRDRAACSVEGSDRVGFDFGEHELPFSLGEPGTGVDPTAFGSDVVAGGRDLAAGRYECAVERCAGVLEPLLLVACG